LHELPYYAKVGVAHLWLVDLEARVVTVQRLEAGRWVTIGAYSDETEVRIEPFDGVLLNVASRWPPAGLSRRTTSHRRPSAADLAVFSWFRKRVTWLTASDPLGIADLLRAGLLVRLLLVGRWTGVIERERDRLRRIVLWLGEFDALASIASLRCERNDAGLPELSLGPRGSSLAGSCIRRTPVQLATISRSTPGCW
jgi:hypothetical protein